MFIIEKGYQTGKMTIEIRIWSVRFDKSRSAVPEKKKSRPKAAEMELQCRDQSGQDAALVQSMESRETSSSKSGFSI